MNNPYHNACHAADVACSLMYFIRNSELQKYLNALDTISALVAALAHDLGHPGFPNHFLIKSRDKIALRYNDKSVLENMHASKLFRILNNEETDIFARMAPEDWFKTRNRIIKMILSTDLSKHFELLWKFKSRAISLNDL